MWIFRQVVAGAEANSLRLLPRAPQNTQPCAPDNAHESAADDAPPMVPETCG